MMMKCERLVRRPGSSRGGGIRGAQFTIIANVPYDTVRQDLVTEFRKFGRVELAMVVCDEASRHPHKEWTSTAGYAFVRFSKRTEAASAIQAATMGLITIRGTRVRADWARKDSYAKRGRVNRLKSGAMDELQSDGDPNRRTYLSLNNRFKHKRLSGNEQNSSSVGDSATEEDSSSSSSSRTLPEPRRMFNHETADRLLVQSSSYSPYLSDFYNGEFEPFFPTVYSKHTDQLLLDLLEPPPTNSSFGKNDAATQQRSNHLMSQFEEKLLSSFTRPVEELMLRSNSLLDANILQNSLLDLDHQVMQCNYSGPTSCTTDDELEASQLADQQQYVEVLLTSTIKNPDRQPEENNLALPNFNLGFGTLPLEASDVSKPELVNPSFREKTAAAIQEASCSSSAVASSGGKAGVLSPTSRGLLVVALSDVVTPNPFNDVSPMHYSPSPQHLLRRAIQQLDKWDKPAIGTSTASDFSTNSDLDAVSE